jgi:hypothetical protein
MDARRTPTWTLYGVALMADDKSLRPWMRLKRHTINQTLLYPLRFEPIYQYRLWGGRRLSDLLTTPLPGDGPIGEAWVLSDRDDHPSQVANGTLKGRTIAQLLQQFPGQLLGKLAHRFRRFPLLLTFLDARKMLSVQVHPSDAYRDLLQAGAESRIYAGLKRGTTADNLRRALTNGTVADDLKWFTSEARRRRFPAGWDGALSRRRRCGVRGSAEQRRDVSPVRLGPC